MFYNRLKRIFDFCLALLGLYFFLPLMALIALLLFLEKGLPIFYLKKTLGKDRKVFDAIKFCSMDKESLSITRVGSFLRKTAMDELPQLINILKGEMSFVGPRAYGIQNYGLPKDFVGREIQNIEFPENNFFLRLKVVPGLTGLAQLYTPKHASNEEVLNWDLKYIKERNFFYDLNLILLSIWITCIGKWERTTKKLA